MSEKKFKYVFQCDDCGGKFNFPIYAKGENGVLFPYCPHCMSSLIPDSSNQSITGETNE